MIFLDLETSGLDPFTHEIMEVGIVTDAEQEVAFSLTFNQFVASPEALEVNGYGVREFAPVVESWTAMGVLKGLLQGEVIVGNNVGFDLSFLRAFYRLHDQEPNWHYQPVELKSLMAGCLNLAPPWKTSDLADKLGVPLPADRHSALADARWNKAAYEACHLKAE